MNFPKIQFLAYKLVGDLQSFSLHPETIIFSKKRAIISSLY